MILLDPSASSGQKNGKPVFSQTVCLDDDEFADRLEGSESFVQAGGVGMLLGLLTTQTVKEREAFYRSYEREAEKWRLQLHSGVRGYEVEIEKGKTRERENDEPEVTNYTLEDLGHMPEDKTGKAERGRKVLMRALQREEDADDFDAEQASMFVWHPKEFLVSEEFFVGSDGSSPQRTSGGGSASGGELLVNPSYLVAAML